MAEIIEVGCVIEGTITVEAMVDVSFRLWAASRGMPYWVPLHVPNRLRRSGFKILHAARASASAQKRARHRARPNGRRAGR
jgi:hypothetical protein